MVRRIARALTAPVRKHPFLLPFVVLYALAALFAGGFLVAYLAAAPLIIVGAVVHWLISSRVRRDELGIPLRRGEHAAYVRINQSPEVVRLVWHDD